MTKPIDLRQSNDASGAVKRLAGRTFGFKEYLVRPLESNGGDPSEYCLFSVHGITYRVERGELSIAKEEG